MNRTVAQIALLSAALLCLAFPAQAAELSGLALVHALQRGGYVIVMRHASAPDRPPSASEADAQNPARERQLDADGRNAAQAMGEAMRQLHIPVGAILSSPTYRARETVRIAALGDPEIFTELGDAGHSMQVSAVAGWAGWLRGKVGEVPEHGKDTLIVTQAPNIEKAFDGDAKGLKAGGALIYRPQRNSAPKLIGRIAIGEWPGLVKQAG
jgi:Histidine phosphatase superfamily (branch 1)